MASLIALFIHFSLRAYFHLKPCGERIDNGRAHTVETSGNLVSAAAKFSAGMKDGKDYFHRRDSRLMVDSDRNSAPIVDDSHGVIRIDGDINGITIAAKRLIDRVVNNLIYQMVQTP